MGSWSVYCGVSNISITSGNDCVLLPLKKNTSHQGYIPYLPATLPIFGRYDDYGGLEDIVEDDNTKLIASHFGLPIHDFCQYFTRGCIREDEDDFPVQLKGVKEIKKWKFMFMDRKVFDFMSTHNSDLYGGHDLGNKGLLTALGAKYLGKFPKKDKRHKYFWDLNGLELKSDGSWLDTAADSRNGMIYSHDPKELVEVLSEDKIEILRTPPEFLWKEYGTKYVSDRMYWILGVDSHYHITLDLLKGMSDRKATEFAKNMGMSTNNTLEKKYINKFDLFGDSVAKLLRIRHNMHCFSQYFNPYVLYLTPQCGEYEAHQKVLEKFAEINKSYIIEEEDY